MAYQLNYTGNEVESLLQRASLLDEDGKAPTAYIADNSIKFNNKLSSDYALIADLLALKEEILGGQW